MYWSYAVRRKPESTVQAKLSDTKLAGAVTLLLFQEGKTCAALKARPAMPGELPSRHVRKNALLFYWFIQKYFNECNQ